MKNLCMVFILYGFVNHKEIYGLPWFLNSSFIFENYFAVTHWLLCSAAGNLWTHSAMTSTPKGGFILNPILWRLFDQTSCFLVCDLNRTPNCYGKTWRFLCPFFRNLHLRENLARDCFTSTVSTVTNSVQISLPIYVIVTNKLLQPLTTTWFD